MEERKEHGLELEVSISDAGTGLNAGIPKAFPDISVQPDIFHELRPVGAELAKLERRAEKLIAEEAGPAENVYAKRRHALFIYYKVKQELQNVKPAIPQGFCSTPVI